MPTRFAITGFNRSGTTMLRTMLNFHRSIACFGEIFNMFNTENANTHRLFLRRKDVPRDFDIATAKRIRNEGTYSQYINFIYGVSSKPFVGAKITRAYPDVHDYILQERRMKKVYLYRYDLLKWAISVARLCPRKFTVGSKPLRLYIPDEWVKKVISNKISIFAKDMKALRKAKQDCVTLPYEMLAQFPGETFDMLMMFLGSPRVPVVRTATTKSATQKMYDTVIVNKDELESMFPYYGSLNANDWSCPSIWNDIGLPLTVVRS